MELISELLGRSELFLTANLPIAIILVGLYLIVNLVVFLALLKESKFYPFSRSSSSGRTAGLREEALRENKRTIAKETVKEIDSFANMLYFLKSDYDFVSIRIKNGRARVVIEKQSLKEGNKVKFVFEEPRLVKILDNLKDRLPIG
jgi:hypothetical protein